MSDQGIPLPYEAKGEPVIDFIPFNGAKFKTVTWKVPSDVEYKGKIIYVHGFFEHSSIYTEVFDKLSQAGYEVFFFDQRGAGATSPGKEVGKTDEYHVFNDLEFMIKHNLDARTNPDEKFILGGHSMGSGIVLNYGIQGKYKDHIRAIFAVGPLIKLHPNTEPNIVLRTLAPVLNKLLPTFKIDSKLNYDYITSNEKWKNYIKSHDTKLIGTVRQFNDMFVRGEKLTKKEYVDKFGPNIPLLLLHGTNDNINYIEGTKKFYELLNDKSNVEFIQVEGGRHSLLIENEEIFNKVFKDLTKFLDSH